MNIHSPLPWRIGAIYELGVDIYDAQGSTVARGLSLFDAEYIIYCTQRDVIKKCTCGHIWLSAFIYQIAS
ncbi:MAG: hypothetical protein MN733_04330 [Nitrososphaera sp.]|nr:hypothetical protein [Nitrososphaera sp.]